jgi:hypothetical protein
MHFRHNNSFLSFDGSAASANDFFDDFKQSRWIEWFDKPTSCTSCAPCLLHEVTGLSSQHQDWDCLELGMLPKLASQSQSIQSRHVLVCQHQIKGLSDGLFIGVQSINGFDNLVSSPDRVNATILRMEGESSTASIRVMGTPAKQKN